MFTLYSGRLSILRTNTTIQVDHLRTHSTLSLKIHVSGGL